MQTLIKHHLDQAVRDVVQSMGRRRWPTPKQGEQLMLKETGLVAEALLNHWHFDPILLSTDFESGADLSDGESAVRRMALWLSASFQPGDSGEMEELVSIDDEDEGDEEDQDSGDSQD